jgi:predicted nucleic acid-binding protein
MPQTIADGAPQCQRRKFRVRKKQDDDQRAPHRSRRGRAGVAWKEAIHKPGTLRILPCELRDLERSWEYFRRPDLHKLSSVDTTSFAIMKRARIRLAYAFDHHFAVVGFRLVA